MIAKIGERPEVVVLSSDVVVLSPSDPDKAIEQLGKGSSAGMTARQLLVESAQEPAAGASAASRRPRFQLAEPPPVYDEVFIAGVRALDEDGGEPPPPAPPAWMGLVIDTLERGTAEYVQLVQERDTLRDELATVRDERERLLAAVVQRDGWIASDRKCAEELHRHCAQITAERDSHRAQLEYQQAQLGGAAHTLDAYKADVRRLDNELADERKLSAARRCEIERLRAARGGEQAQRIVDLEAKVKRVTSTGADLLLDRDALVRQIRGWARALCGYRERTAEQALADVDAEIARLAEPAPSQDTTPTEVLS